jgi:hypothetical protein
MAALGTPLAFIICQCACRAGEAVKAAAWTASARRSAETILRTFDSGRRRRLRGSALFPEQFRAGSV